MPLAHWKLDEAQGTTAADSSGNGNNGTTLGNPVWRTSGGWIGGALEFDGRNDYVKVEKPKGFNFAPNSFSVSTWIYPKETRGRWHAIMEYDRNSLNGNRFGLWLDVEGRFHFRVGQNTWQSPDALAPNQWYHLTATFDAGSKAMKLYVDGLLAATATYQKGFVTPTQATLIIGARGSVDDEYFLGLMDDIRVFKVALTRRRSAHALRRRQERRRGRCGREHERHARTGSSFSIRPACWRTCPSCSSRSR